MTEVDPRVPRDPLVFRKARDVVGPPQREKTDEEIRAEMKDIVRRNAAVLQALAKL
ncbi:hypothetical protein [Deinococcus marmoris]|uniref:Mobile element protein n=1 Tax=Deinococcus marmoris TaxID=249408 RepID=A0A1U7NRD8_9DEIO|nr:hypothetical protein [Deinococcus marmoris]OLV15478.1 hypothetical protein BOO71_0014671 [Deinococcus marmoris]